MNSKDSLLKLIDRLFKIDIISIICVVFIFCYIYSHFILLRETEILTKYLIDTGHILPEWKTKFIKNQIAVNGNSITSEKGMMIGMVQGIFLSRMKKRDDD